ncbi:trypsin-like peptidase domain-containing protein [Paenibacillus oenotherae]|uniref:Trypsin-like peptidase domain-containing protein n=1 Tax=Paenibacillus oenotherae TaxID=1435645 RepID=A0ABS7D432_9BACL|nr:trypsin-like peptidase domain-containing protein [Paenibacillus oenotherae]MBW7474624.1 trypsin-like peptidase domain-containing protein [Paenibacillus oenotherae]
MDDRNNNNPYDDFFHNNKNGQENEDGAEKRDAQNGHKMEEDQEGEGSKTSYYYSYGPFKPTQQQGESSRVIDGASGAPANESVVVTPPAQIRPFAPTQSAKGGWQVKEPRRRTSFKTVFASFLVGVLTVGSLMFAADYQNWFTGEQSLVQSVMNQGTNTGAKVGDDGKVSTAADVVRPNNIAQIFEQASPAVVKIETLVQQRSVNNNRGLLDDPFFRQFFGDDLPDDRSSGSSGSNELVPSGMGTGFFFDSSGYILTNQHVLGDATDIQVTVQGYDKPLKAKKLGANYNLDLAVLKVEGDNFPTLSLGSSDQIDIGDWVVAIGNPYGFDHTVTVGVLSSKERPISIPDEQGERKYEHLLQTDASINPGNSGGPLLNLKGEVIGINTAVSSQAQGIGFAIPTSTILKNLDNLKANKEIPKEPAPFIGAQLQDVTDEMVKQLGLPAKGGAIVQGVVLKSPAYLADLRQFDVIVGIDGTKYADSAKLTAQIQTKKVGDKVVLNIYRNGKAMDLPVEIGNRNDFE